MAKKKVTNDTADALVAIELIQSLTKLAQDPLWSSLLGWWWVQKRSDLGWDDRTALRMGIIDINRARANVEGTAILTVLDQATSLVDSLSKSAALGAAVAANPVAGGAAAAVSSFGGGKKTKKQTKEEEIAYAIELLNKHGALQ